MNSRLGRFPQNRFVGTRDDMIVYDCDDESAFAALKNRVELEDLVGRQLLSTFGPDSLAEARNRGFLSP
ncbi:MAG: hypothetical protein V3S62_10190 [Acidimicrobiia bacterium]